MKLVLDCMSKPERTPYGSRSGVLLKETLLQAGFSLDEVKYSQDPGDAWDGYDAILILGKETHVTLFPGGPVFGKVINLPIWSEEFGCYVISTHHPIQMLEWYTDSFTGKKKEPDPDLFRDFANSASIFRRAPKNQVIHKAPRILTPSTLPEVLQAMGRLRSQASSSHLVCDLETVSNDPIKARILEVGLMADPSEAVVIEPKFLKSPKVRNALEKLLNTTYSGGHNCCQFDSAVLAYQHRIDWEPKWDTMFAHCTLDERQDGHTLKELGMQELFLPDWDLHVDYKSGATMESVPVHTRRVYLGWDLYSNYHLFPSLWSQMEAEDVTTVHSDILVPGAYAFRDIETEGALVDREYLLDLVVKIGQEESELLEKVTAYAQEQGMPNFNHRSPKQVKDLLYGHLKLPIQLNKERKPGSGVDELKKIKHLHPVVQMIVDARVKSMTRSTFIEGLLSRIHPITGRIHASFLLFGARTGRLSCQDPNLQNVPMVMGPIIRDAFIADDGWVLMEADYNQLELKVVALFSQDPHLLHVFSDINGDIHSEVGVKIFKKPARDITKPERYKAKLINFGIVYGRSARSLSEQEEFDSTEKEAQDYIDAFLTECPGLAKWIKEQHTSVDREGICVTPFKRKRRFPLITKSNMSGVHRQAQNTPVQGTASDLCLTALTRLHRRFKAMKETIAKVIFTVHDSILLLVKEGHEEEVARIVWEEMVDNAPLAAPFKFTIDIGWGKRWGSLTHQFPPKCKECEHKYPDWALAYKAIKGCPHCNNGEFKFAD